MRFNGGALRLTRDEEIEPLPVCSRELWRLTRQSKPDGAHMPFAHNDLQGLNAIRDQKPSKHGEPDEDEEQVETCRSSGRRKARNFSAHLDGVASSLSVPTPVH